MRYTLLVIIIISLNSIYCNSNGTNAESMLYKVDFEVKLKPAWAESSLITVSQSEFYKKLAILIRNDQRADPSEDTLYFIQQVLFQSDWDYLDSLIFEKARQTFELKPMEVLDGFSFDVKFSERKDTNRIFLQSPYISNTSEYLLAKAILIGIRKVNKDSIVDNYLEDITHIIDKSDNQNSDFSKPLFKLREREYNWKYSR